ncbi:MAG: hypothetical protein AAB553_00795 [Patescibacteria group bacterium]
MKKFILIFYGKVRPEDISKEEMQSTMDKWMAWFGTFKDQMVDGGNPFAVDAKSITAKGVETISPDMMPATGYTIINAKDIDEATKIAEGCPVLEEGGNGAIRVYEAMAM